MEFALGRKRVSEWESTLWIPEMLNLLTAYTITPNGGRIGAPMPPALAPGTSSWDPFGRTRRAEFSSDSAILATSFESRLCWKGTDLRLCWTWNSFVRNVFFFPILNCDQKTLFTMQPMQNAMNIFDTGGDAWPWKMLKDEKRCSVWHWDMERYGTTWDTDDDCSLEVGLH